MGETKLETIKDITVQFEEIQRYMQIAKEEKATKTYAELKIKYMSLKTLLQVAGVNLTDIDIIKE